MNESGLAILIFAVIVIALIPSVFYMLTLQNTLNEVKPENRTMNPGQVWLLFIPFFGIVWHFIVIHRVADSLSNEYKSRGITPDEERPGYNVGLAFLICGLCGIIPFIGILASLGALVCWIIYWSKINNYKNDLARFSNTLDKGF